MAVPGCKGPFEGHSMRLNSRFVLSVKLLPQAAHIRFAALFARTGHRSYFCKFSTLQAKFPGNQVFEGWIIPVQRVAVTALRRVG